MPLQTAGFGPFSRGVIDTANPSLELTGTLRSAVGTVYTGLGQLSERPGTRLVLTLKDDAGSPTDVTSVCAVVPFTDGALAVAHSTVTNKAYLYKLTAALDGWTDSSGVAQTTLAPHPIAVLWTSITSPPVVSIAEGLGVAYIAHAGALDASALHFPTKTFDDSTRAIATLQSDLDDDGTSEDVYFTGVIAFQQHLFGWGFGAGTVVGSAYRPEVLRFSNIYFDDSGGNLFEPADFLLIGNRIRSDREAIVGAGIAGASLYVSAPYLRIRITGFDRDSWYREPVDGSFGSAGPQSMVTVGDTLYDWCSRGPVRMGPGGAPDPLWERIPAAVQSVTALQTIVAGYDEARDTVYWVCDTGSGVRTVVGYHVRLNVFASTGDDWGQAIRAMGAVAPVVHPASTGGSTGPSAAPTTPTTSSIGSTSAVATWLAGDLTATSRVEIRAQGGSTWTPLIASLAAGQQTYTMTGLSASTAYEWRVAHVKGGQTSAYVGPVAGSQFTTAAPADQLLPPSDLSVGPDGTITGGGWSARWTNSGETGVSTELWTAGPAETDPVTGYALTTTAGVGASSTTGTVASSGVWWFQVRHTRSGATDSDFTASVSQSLAVA